LTPTDDAKPKRVVARRVRSRLPTTAAVLAAITVTLAVLLLIFAVLVGIGVDPGPSLAIGAVVGLAAGTTFFLGWRRRGPERRRTR
jgi:protein-S-isoprenylcysteine O-methyltransferase Ste14